MTENPTEFIRSAKKFNGHAGSAQAARQAARKQHKKKGQRLSSAVEPKCTFLHSTTVHVHVHVYNVVHIKLFMHDK